MITLKMKTRNSTDKNLIFALVLLFTANMIMGIIMAKHGKDTCMKITRQRMLDIANTAADMLNGDVIEEITHKDLNTPEYQQEYYILSEFQKNIELSYIYAVRPGEDGSFDFVIDPDPEAPAEFGTDIVVTDALSNAFKGTADVEKTPHTDYWGKFYSAYSPVFNSEGNVTCIVGVDFDAELVEREVIKHVVMITAILAVVMVLGTLFALSISFKSRQRIALLKQELEEIQNGFRDLNRIMMESTVAKLEVITDDKKRELLQTLASGEDFEEEKEDEFTGISQSLHAMQNDLSRYIRFLNEQTFIDPMTGVGNKSAYQARVRKIDEAVAEKKCRFHSCVFRYQSVKVD